MVFLSLTNGGAAAYNALVAEGKASEFMGLYKDELTSIHRAFSTHPNHAQRFKARRAYRIKQKKDFNHEASYMNTAMCDFENQILMNLWEFMGKPINSVLCFDGIMLLKNVKVDLKSCENYILKTLNIRISLKFKTMDEGFEIKSEPSDHLEMKLLTSDMMDEDFAEFFVAKYNGWVQIRGDSDIYQFQTGRHIWTRGSEDLLYEFLGHTMYHDLREVLDRRFKNIELAGRHAAICKTLSQTLRRWSHRTGIVKCILPKIAKNHDIFDQKPHLIGFNNGIFDLLTEEFRQGEPADLVSKSCGYDYSLPNIEKKAHLMGFISQIMPVENEKDFLLRALSTTLYGQVVQNFFILTGEGSNGKDTLVSKLLKFTLGTDYFEYSNTCILTEKRKGALSQELANLNKKRAAVWNEPPRASILQGGPIKELTGASEINARALYSKNTSTQLMESCFMLCNDIPRIDNVDGGVARRMVVIPFRSLFKTEEEIKAMSNTDNVYPVDRYFDSDEFRNEYKMTLFHILYDYFKVWRDDKFLFKRIPKTIKDLSARYLQDSDDFISWFNEVYEKSENTDDYIQIKEIFSAFKDSDLYNNLTKREKRLMTRKNMIEQVRKHPTLRGYYKNSLQPIINNRRKLIRHALKGFRLKPLEGESDDEEQPQPPQMDRYPIRLNGNKAGETPEEIVDRLLNHGNH
jgi:P4 family phage/plasmid primase-like protien